MGISASTILVGIVFVALYLALLLWRRAASRKMEALTVTLRLPPNADVERVNELEETLAKAVEQDGAGRLSGDQFRADGCTFYLQGPSAERLLQAIVAPLKEFHPPAGSYLVKRYGAAGAREERVELSEIS